MNIEPGGVWVEPRTAWQTASQPIAGPGPTGQEANWIIHYTAAPTIGADTAQVLRNMQNDYTTNRGYSLGYNWAIDKTGTIWEIRGTGFRNAANSGGKMEGNYNQFSRSILMLVDGADPANAAMVAACNALIATQPTWTVAGHDTVEWTSCPGPGLQAQLFAEVIGQNAGTLPPMPPPETPGSVIVEPGESAWSCMRRLGLDPADEAQRLAFYERNVLFHPGDEVFAP